ncbi:hypothetical protein ES704_00058 [subsurface metagenome]|jgi:hypothetical protein
MIKIKKYESKYKSIWDEFITKSKNGTFLFYRDYMEYHSDRFNDFSLMIYKENKLITVLPANINEETLISHGGLTFGGFIINYKMTAALMLIIFKEVIKFVHKKHIKKLIYKCIPYIYHLFPAEEDRYALFKENARLYRRDISTTIYLPKKLQYKELRRRCIKKAIKANLIVNKTDDYKTYWNILNSNLEKRYDTKPVHSLSEIEYLHNKFPDNIKLFASHKNNTMLAGVVIYENLNIAHAQYIASNEEGRKIGALDMLFSYLIEDYYHQKKYFDFGISNENNGQYLNNGLISFKEGFGASGVAYDSYEIIIK